MILLDTPPCRVGCMRKLAHTPPRAGEEYGSNTTRRSRVVFGPYSSPARGGVWGQIQRDKPKYHEAKPSGIWAYRAVLASQLSQESHLAVKCQGRAQRPKKGGGENEKGCKRFANHEIDGENHVK